ncbi:MAG: hydrogenase maturation protease [Planctomycetes bacterium]|nr:hydrogenase maturation protease [Planctomycetota bacterium]
MSAPGSLEPELRRELAALRQRDHLVLGVGNDLRGDDGFGPELARQLAARGGRALDAGTAPESMTGPLRRAAPALLLIADAAELGAPPGTLRLLDPAELAPGATGTHDPSLRLLLTFLAAELSFEVRLLAVQPAHRDLGAAMSAPVAAALAAAVDALAP